MVNKDYIGAAFQASTFHDGDIFYVGSGRGEDIPVDDNRYLVMVNQNGDQVAHHSKGNGWIVDKVALKGLHRAIPTSKHAIKVSLKK